MSKVEELIADLRALDTWASRVRLLSEHVFPPSEYMRRVYGQAAPLPALYVRRFAEGAGRWFRR
jgi:hypothetical protein